MNEVKKNKNYLSLAKVSSWTGLSRIFGLIRDVVTTNLLGASVFHDIFVVTLKIPNLFRRFFAEGAFNQAFIPIYSDYQNDLKAVRKDIENMSNLSGAERLETKKNLQQKKLDIQGQYEEKFKKIMTIEKVAKIDQAEREFKKWLVEQLKRQIP